MTYSPFTQMQKAVDIVNTSPHPQNKIAATIFTDTLSVSHTNYWPYNILHKIGTDIRIGNASGTIHAETACILATPYTHKASICITDPFCPNCAKNIAEAGIKTIYIDHKGFNKDFAARREHAFANMSMKICEKAGISVYELWRKEERLNSILEVPADYQPHEENPITLKTAKDDFLSHITKAHNSLKDMKCAIAYAENDDGQIIAMTARDHPVIGYTLETDLNDIENPQGKYSFIQEPINRLLMAAPCHGLKIIDNMIYCSQIPTAREQVNMVGAGITNIYIGDKEKSRDEYGLQALKLMEDKGVLSYTSLP